MRSRQGVVEICAQPGEWLRRLSSAALSKLTSEFNPDTNFFHNFATHLTA